MSYTLYIVCCADGTLYTGIATDVERRLSQHNGAKGKGARYTAARRPVRLVYQAPYPTRSAALSRDERAHQAGGAGADHDYVEGLHVEGLQSFAHAPLASISFCFSARLSRLIRASAIRAAERVGNGAW